MQNTGNEIFWAGHNGNSKIRIFSLAEGSNRYFWRDVTINSWPNSNYTSNAQDNLNWLAFGFPGAGIIGATRRDITNLSGQTQTQLWFAWGAGIGGGFAQPHIQIAQFDRTNNFNLIAQVQVWNSTIAFAYPSLATNLGEEVGMALAFGGGGSYATFAVGFWGDFVVFYPEASGITASYTVTPKLPATPFTQPRFGDYVSIRQSSPDSSQFAAFGYAVQSDPLNTSGCSGNPAGGCKFDPSYVLFDRLIIIGSVNAGIERQHFSGQ